MSANTNKQKMQEQPKARRAWTWLNASQVVVPLTEWEGRILNLQRPTVVDVALGDDSALVRLVKAGDTGSMCFLNRLALATWHESRDQEA